MLKELIKCTTWFISKKIHGGKGIYVSKYISQEKETQIILELYTMDPSIPHSQIERG